MDADRDARPQRAAARPFALGEALRRGATSLALVLAAVMVGLLVRDVQVRLDTLDTAYADNLQWTLTQAETELQVLHLRLHEVKDLGRSAPEDFAELRDRFNVFYSRIATIRDGRAFALLGGIPEFRAEIEKVQRFLDAEIPLIDGPDAALAAGIDGLTERAEAIAGDVRSLGLIGIQAEARRSEALREEISATLIRLAAATAALVAALAAMAAALWSQSRRNARRAEAEAQTAARLEAVLRTSLDAIVVADRAGRILDFNGAAERVFGHPAQGVIGRSVSEALLPASGRAGHAAGMRRWAEGGAPRIVGQGPVELDALHADGHVFPIELSLQSARLDGRDLLVAFARDITARREAQLALVEARDRAMAGEKAKADFVAVMSHEIRTPLNGILGALSLLRDARDAEERAGLMRMMDVSGRILLDQVNDVLDISRIDAGRMELRPRAADLPALLEDVAESQRPVAEQRGDVIVTAWEGPPPPPLLIDVERLRQVLVNLVSNAVKFTEGGEVRLEGEIVGTGPAAEIEIRVSDTGIGIPPEDLSLIFNDFETLDRSRARWRAGAGLGLGIARRVVQAMGGAIEAVSEPGEGSLFTVTLPCRPAEGAGPAGGCAGAQESPPAGLGLRVLVVEDNEINREVLGGMLRRRGCTVDMAPDGVEGVAAAGARRYDLILADIGMPRMDGYEAVRRIRGGDGPSARAPIHAVTADPTVSAAPGFAAAGFDGVLTKPLSPEDLDALLGAAAGARRRRAAGRRRAAALDLDPARLAVMREELGAEAACDLLRRFATEAEAVAPGLAGLLAADPAEAGRAAHRMAGAAAGFGADAMAGALRALDLSVRMGDREAAAIAARDAAAAWARCRGRIAAECGGAQAG